MSVKRAAHLGIDGTRTSGDDIRIENVTAAVAIANIVKTSLGPMGLDKMLVDELGEMLVTNDGATILQKLEVEHPSAKVLVDLAKLQDEEIGDGTTSVVVLAAELLKRANVLIQQNIHPTNIISGYKLAAKEAQAYLKENLTMKVNELPKDSLVNVAKTSMASKVIGSENELFSKIIVDAIQSIKTINDMGDVVYPVSAVNILKQHGKSSKESSLVKGYALNCTKASQQMPTGVKNCKIAILDIDLRPIKMKMGIQFLINKPEAVEEIKKREADITKERISKLIKAGANVIMTTGGIDDAMMKYLVESNVYGVRRVKKDDLKRIAKVTGGTLLGSLSDLSGEEVVDPANFGTAEKVYEQRFADDECTIIETKAGSCASIILRGANTYMLDEMHRSVHDSLCAVSRTLEANAVVAGGGAVEVALNAHLEAFAASLGSKEQLAIAEFAQALLVIPKCLCINAALDATDLVAKLKVAHVQARGKKQENVEQRFWGLDLVDGQVRNNITAGVLEPAPSKVKSFRFATEAAITILRIDDLIRINEEVVEEDEMMRRRRGM